MLAQMRNGECQLTGDRLEQQQRLNCSVISQCRPDIDTTAPS